MVSTTDGGRVWQGSNWIRRAKRYSIYADFDHRCAYCGTPVSTGDRRGAPSLLGTSLATLDHVRSRENGGDNDRSNLVCACTSCNASKADRHVGEFMSSTRYGASLLLIAAAIVRGAEVAQ